MSNAEFTAEGGCACGAIRYRLTAAPLFVHCCHCLWCQRETGSAFVLNALIETACVERIKGAPNPIATPSESGKGQTFYRCPTCQVALWSYYVGARDAISFVRVGTLDDPAVITPDIHIFTASKQPWVVLPENVPSVEAYYSARAHWPAESLERRRIAKEKPRQGV